MVNYCMRNTIFGVFFQASSKCDFTSSASAFWNESRVANRPGTLGMVHVLDTPLAGPPAGVEPQSCLQSRALVTVHAGYIDPYWI